jgi:dolichol-phosphate mannosyltransferase
MSNINATIVVPAFSEGLNLEALIERVFAALAARGMEKTTEMIIVDDNSPDQSVAVVEQQAKKHRVRIIVRKGERGLSSAVMRGFDEAQGEALLCMDADLQHPPERVPDLLDALFKGAEFVIGTRYGKGVAIDKNWPLHRRIISKGARLLARPLTTLSDPMTGFFGVQKKAYMAARKAGTLSPKGFKIAMEVFVKTGVTKVVEIPFDFGTRVYGESKLTSKVVTQYLLHLNDLYRYRIPIFLPLLACVAFALLYWLACNPFSATRCR